MVELLHHRKVWFMPWERRGLKIAGLVGWGVVNAGIAVSMWLARGTLWGTWFWGFWFGLTAVWLWLFAYKPCSDRMFQLAGWWMIMAWVSRVVGLLVDSVQDGVSDRDWRLVIGVVAYTFVSVTLYLWWSSDVRNFHRMEEARCEERT
jgi:hypothetical protein